MGKRSRRRNPRRAKAAPPARAINVSATGTCSPFRERTVLRHLQKVRQSTPTPAPQREDRWQRRGELLFDRLAGGPGPSRPTRAPRKKLLSRYRMRQQTSATGSATRSRASGQAPPLLARRPEPYAHMPEPEDSGGAPRSTAPTADSNCLLSYLLAPRLATRPGTLPIRRANPLTRHSP